MGINEAENYIAETFESFGLTPLPGREDYFLEFILYRGGFDPEATTLAIRIGGTNIEGLAGVDFRLFGHRIVSGGTGFRRLRHHSPRVRLR